MFPKNVKVGPYNYRVFCDHARIARARLEHESGRIGQCDFHSLEIFVDPDAARDMRDETLIHEMLHAILDITRPFDEEHLELEEKVISAISPMLLDTIRSNPELISHLLSE